MNLSKETLNRYLNKIYNRAKDHIMGDTIDPLMDVDTQIAVELKVGITLGIFHEFDVWGDAISVLNRPFLGGCYYDEDEHLQDFKDSVDKWLTPEAKQTLGIKEA